MAAAGVIHARGELVWGLRAPLDAASAATALAMACLAASSRASETASSGLEIGTWSLSALGWSLATIVDFQTVTSLWASLVDLISCFAVIVNVAWLWATGFVLSTAPSFSQGNVRVACFTAVLGLRFLASLCCCGECRLHSCAKLGPTIRMNGSRFHGTSNSINMTNITSSWTMTSWMMVTPRTL